jgi:hypothetical protein
MDKKRLTFAEAKRFSITDYLSSVGIEPARKGNVDWWYLSPFRQERTASFKVNTKLNLWYDHGEGQGGTILDLGARLEKCTINEFRDSLSAGTHAPLSFHRESAIKDEPASKVEVISIEPLSDKLLLQYLKSRGIAPETARAYCKEVKFKIGKAVYRAIGFPNRSGGMELRNTWFKGSASPKDITIIDGSQDKIAVFEGFINFLTFIELKNRNIAPVVETGFIIMNSVSFVARALDILVPSSKEVTLYVDNDLAGNSAKQKISDRGLAFRDGSQLYVGYEDLNEYLVALLKVEAKEKWVQKRSRGSRM